MIRKAECPDEKVLSSVLDPMMQLSVEVDDHLGACQSCQSKLELLAAESSWWSDTESVLSESSVVDEQTAGRIAQAVCPLAADDQGSGDEVLRRNHADLELQRLKGALEAASHPELLGRIGRYELEQLVGYGGMGLVFRARDLELHRVVAVKTISSQFLAHPAARQRFLREARASASLVHPHIVAVHDIIQDSPIPAIVMQFVAGPTLQQHLDSEGPLPWREALRLGVQLCDALQQAHDGGLIHRDIKPGNVLLEGGGQRAMLTDFGLVRALDAETMTHTGAITGTPEYMSPEQAWGSELDCRSDLFSLGTLLYSMLTGAPPFRAEAPMATLNLVCNASHRPINEVAADVPKEVVRLVDRLLQKQPRKRWSSAVEVRRHMAHLLQSDIVLRPRNPVNKILLLILAFVLASAGALAGLSYLDYGKRSPTMQKPAFDPYAGVGSLPRHEGLQGGFGVFDETDVAIEEVERQLRQMEASMAVSAQPPSDSPAWEDRGHIDEGIENLSNDLRRLERENDHY